MPRKIGRELVIPISQGIVDSAMRRDSHRCAIADGLKAAYPDASHISVDLQSVRLTLGAERRTYWTPADVQRYLIAFDAGQPIEPRTVKLRNLVQVRPSGRVARGLKAATLEQGGRSAPIKVGGAPMPRARKETATRGFGIRGMLDNA